MSLFIICLLQSSLVSYIYPAGALLQADSRYYGSVTVLEYEVNPNSCHMYCICDFFCLHAYFIWSRVFSAEDFYLFSETFWRKYETMLLSHAPLHLFPLRSSDTHPGWRLLSGHTPCPDVLLLRILLYKISSIDFSFLYEHRKRTHPLLDTPSEKIPLLPVPTDIGTRFLSCCMDHDFLPNISKSTISPKSGICLIHPKHSSPALLLNPTVTQ